MSNYPTDPKLQWLRGSRGGRIRRAFLAHYLENPAIGANTSILAATPLTTAVQTFTATALNQPDVARCVLIKGNVAGITGDVVIVGVDANNQPLTETITANGSAVVEGTKAFARIVSITLPIRNASGNTMSIGTTNKLGLPHLLTFDGRLLTHFDGATDAGVLTMHATEVARNVFTPAGTLDGTKKLRIVYIV